MWWNFQFIEIHKWRSHWNRNKKFRIGQTSPESDPYNTKQKIKNEEFSD